MSEEELFALAADGDEGAVETLLACYKSIVTANVRRYFLVGGDSEDLAQEGMIALYRAIKTYRPESGAFAAYAAGCVKNRLLDVIKSANRDKHKALNGYIPLADADELLGAGMSAEEIAISRESGRDLAKALDSGFSDDEKALSAACPNAEVRYAAGYPYAGNDENGFAEALGLARWADVVVCTLGGHYGWNLACTTGEGLDSQNIGLPACQEAFLRALAPLGKPVVGVHFDGRPCSSDAADAVCGALVEAWTREFPDDALIVLDHSGRFSESCAGEPMLADLASRGSVLPDLIEPFALNETVGESSANIANAVRQAAYQEIRSRDANDKFFDDLGKLRRYITEHIAKCRELRLRYDGGIPDDELNEIVLEMGQSSCPEWQRFELFTPQGGCCNGIFKDDTEE